MSRWYLAKAQERRLAVAVFAPTALLVLAIASVFVPNFGWDWGLVSFALLTVSLLAWTLGPEMSAFIRRGDGFGRPIIAGVSFVVASYALAAPIIAASAVGLSDIQDLAAILFGAVFGFFYAASILSYGFLIGAAAGLVFAWFVLGDDD